MSAARSPVCTGASLCKGHSPGRGARLVAAEPARDWRCPRESSWHPPGCCGHVSQALAPRRGARPSDAVFRRSFPLCPERPPATLCQPCGLASTTEFCGKYPNSRAGHPCPAEGALALPHGVELRVYVRTARCHPLTQASGQPSGCCFPRTARQSRAEASASANLLRLPIKPA